MLRKEINKLGWKKYFKILVGANDAKKDKPSKYPFLLALKKISLKPNKNIWYVGDNEIDVEFAKKNKCLSIFIENNMFKKKNEAVRNFITACPTHKACKIVKGITLHRLFGVNPIDYSYEYKKVLEFKKMELNIYLLMKCL